MVLIDYLLPKGLLLELLKEPHMVGEMKAELAKSKCLISCAIS